LLYQIVGVFPLDAKLQTSVFKDKQEFQEVKTRREATQLKRAVVSHSGHFIPDEYTPADHCT